MDKKINVTFSNFGNYGRLGNQLWQYAFLKAYQLKRKDDVNVFLPKLSEKYWHGQPCLLENFNISIPQNEQILIHNLFVEKDPQDYNENIYSINDDVDFLGFFQNMKYFINYEEEVRKDLTLKNLYDIESKKILDSIRKNGKEIVSLHVRRGDLVSQVNDQNYFTENGIFFKYMEKAISFFDDDKYYFLIFSGGSRDGDDVNDVIWCKQNLYFLKGKQFNFCHSNDALAIFSLMQNCDHNIMSHASSFSWWACYLNQNKHKKVIAPKFYFIDRPEKIVDNFYPKEFILI